MKNIMTLVIWTITLVSVFFAIICTTALAFLMVKTLFQVAKEIFKYLISPEGFIILIGYLAAATLYINMGFQSAS